MSHHLNQTPDISDLETEENYLFSAEKEAEKIVDEIFSELDDILDPREEYLNYQEDIKPKEPVLEEDNSPLALEAELLSEITPKKEEIIEQKYFDSTAFAQQEVLPENEGFSKNFDKLLFAGSLSFLIGVMAWLISIEKLKFPLIANQTETTVARENITSSPDQEFANYLLQSLKIIDQETPIIASNSEPINNQKVPEKTPPNNINNSHSSPTKIIERIYIPFVQSNPTPSQPIFTPPPPVKQTPSLPPPVKQTPPPVKQTPSLPLPVKQTPPPPVKQTPPPPPVTENKIETPVTEVANAVRDRHTVVGLLELGDRNAALIEVNGVTRRVQVEETIGSSGWVLESVDNDLIIIKNKDQQRSLSVGQQF
jgi:hypothetical protein